MPIVIIFLTDKVIKRWNNFSVDNKLIRIGCLDFFFFLLVSFFIFFLRFQFLRRCLCLSFFDSFL